MDDTLAAWTACDGSTYPAYLNISKVSGGVRVILRDREALENQVTFSRAEWNEFLRQLNEHGPI